MPSGALKPTDVPVPFAEPEDTVPTTGVITAVVGTVPYELGDYGNLPHTGWYHK